jgi:hypothetical protein
MSAETLSTFDLALKTFFVQEVVDDIPYRVPFFKTISGSMKDRPTGGRSLTATWAVETGANLGWDTLTESGDLAVSRTGTRKNYSLSVAHMSFSTEFSGHLEASGTRRDMTFFYDVAEKFTNDTKKVVTMLMGILVMLDGTANLGTILSVSTNTITLDTGQIHNFLLTMRLTVRDTASGGTEQLSSAQPASGTITSVEEPQNRFTIADATGAVAGDFLALYEFYGAVLPNAIRNIISETGTFQGQNRATAGLEFARGRVRTDTGPLTDDLIIRTAHDVMKMTRDTDPTADWVALTDFDSERWLYLTKSDQVRYTANEKIVGGYKGVAVSTGGNGTLTLATDQRAWPGEIAMFAPKDFGFLRPTTGLSSGWVENGGTHFFQKTGSAAGRYADAKQCFWIERYNIFCDEPRNTARLTGYRSI